MATKREQREGLEAAEPEMGNETAQVEYEPISEAEVVDWLLAYETDELEPVEVFRLFQTLINTGQAWQLQGHYGRMAEHLIDTGVCKEA